jgi:aspartate racemase
MKGKNKPIIILGGMGPEASARMLQLMVDMAAEKFSAGRTNQFPEIIVDSIPVPDFISDFKNVPVAKKMLRSRISLLNFHNPASFALACNTAHLLLGELQKASKAPFVSMIDAAVEEIAACKLEKVGILATPVTLKTRLFQDALLKKGISCITPGAKNRKLLQKVIRKVIAGKCTSRDTQVVSQIAALMVKNGARGILLGCTELPLIFPKNFPVKVFDSLEILSEALLKDYFNNKTIARKSKKS